MFYQILCVFLVICLPITVEAKKKNEHQYELAVCAIFKDDADYLKEWIEYNKLIGVQHFRLYNNDSTDNYKEVLQPYIAKGEVTLIEWPNANFDLSGKYGWVYKVQAPAIIDAIKAMSKKTKWLAIIDTDEFILPLKHANLLSFLGDYESYAGVLINWQCYGTSYISDIPAGKLMIETLTMKAEEYSDWNIPVKTICRPERVDTSQVSWIPHTWFFKSKKDITALPNKQPYKIFLKDTSIAVINHYVHRTHNYFINYKVPKKERMEGNKLTAEYIEEWETSCNQVEDLSISRFVPELRKRMGM